MVENKTQKPINNPNPIESIHGTMFIQINPIFINPLNLDYDGDQQTVHLVQY